jgi:hypothetical protein
VIEPSTASAFEGIPTVTEVRVRLSVMHEGSMLSKTARISALSLRLSVWLTLIATVLVTAAVTGHISILLLYNSPDNYAKIKFDAAVNAYVGKLLFQRWNFFAPNPIAENEYLLARARDAHGATTPWINVTKVLIRDLQSDRFSPYEFMLTGVSNGVLDMPSRYDAGKLAKQHVDLSLLNGFRQLIRTGASLLSSQYPDAPFSEIQIAFLYDPLPKFSDRAKPSASEKASVQVFSWQRYPRGVDSSPW